MFESSAERRRLVRAAVRTALLDTDAASDSEIDGVVLAEEIPLYATNSGPDGVVLGEAVQLTPEELEADLEDEQKLHRVTIGVTVFFGDTPVEDPCQIENPLADYLELHQFGEWLGGGQGSHGDQSFFDMLFAVECIETVLPVIQRTLRELGAGPTTELHASDGQSFILGSAA